MKYERRGAAWSVSAVAFRPDDHSRAPTEIAWAWGLGGASPRARGGRTASLSRGRVDGPCGPGGDPKGGPVWGGWGWVGRTDPARADCSAGAGFGLTHGSGAGGPRMVGRGERSGRWSDGRAGTAGQARAGSNGRSVLAGRDGVRRGSGPAGPGNDRRGGG